MLFSVSTLGYIQTTQSIILDYQVTIDRLPRADTILEYGELGNFSLAGFQMVTINKALLIKHSFIEDAVKTCHVLCHHLLHSIWTVCRRILDFLPHTS